MNVVFVALMSVTAHTRQARHGAIWRTTHQHLLAARKLNVCDNADVGTMVLVLMVALNMNSKNNTAV